jgi:predicted outer membrane repeat protein
MVRRWRRPPFVILLLAVELAGFASVPTDARAASRCTVRDTTSDRSYEGGGGKLQAAIFAAARDSSLIVRGHCVGTYHVRKAMTIIGRPSKAFPIPTLDAHREGITLTVLGIGRVEVRDLRITGGKGDDRLLGGGIYNKARLILSGTTRVSKNAGGFGAGVWSRGWLELRDEAEVVRNNARPFFGTGGGIYNAGGLTRLRNSSMVHANIATGNGGGVFLFNGHLVVRESGSITANEAGNYGGGVYAESKMTLRGSAKVTGNTAASSGGIYSDLRVFVCSSSVKISPNNPDDPPNTKSCT